jgi:predicted nucleic acid-binding Zn ribbon protein
MKIHGDRKLGDVIREMIENYRMEGKLNEVKLLHSWEKVVGDMIARHTRDLKIINRKLFVSVDSPALRNELTYSRGEIVKKLNEEAGAEVIDDIVFK